MHVLMEILMQTPVAEPKVIGYECRHATYSPTHTPNGSFTNNDVHVVKEYVYTDDGLRTPRVRCINNFEREFYITHAAQQNHKDKKEYESIANLQRYTTTQCRMTDSISRALYHRPGGATPLRQLAKSPYLYGCDISSTALVKKSYESKWPELMHPSASVAVLDIETDVVHGTEDIIIISLTFKQRIYTAICTRFIPLGRNPAQHVHALIDTHLGDILKERQATVEIGMFDTPAACCKAVIARAHEWMPDFVVLWNMNFDIPRIIRTLEAAGDDLADVFSDPCVPKANRFFKYTEGKSQKVTQSGKTMPLHPADRWHIAECPASFYIVDAMCIYKRIRTAKGNEPSYALDYVLNKHVGKGKLSLPAYDHYHGLAWHRAMQQEQPFFYVVYNIYDCVGVEMLDEITNDVCATFPTLCGNSDFRNFTSNPRRLVDDLHYFYLNRGGVVATTGVDMTDENDESVVGLSEWIVTLPTHLVADNGISLIKGYETLRSMVRIHLADLDIEGTYPTIQVVANISKETTLRELSRIKNITDRQQRMIGINLSGGVVNAVEIGNMAFQLPTLSEWLVLAQADPNF